MPNDIIMLSDLAWTNDSARIEKICEELYNKYYDNLNLLYKDNCPSYITFMTHISFTMKLLSRHIERDNNIWVINQIALHSVSLLNIISEYEEIDFSKMQAWQMITVCHSIKNLIGLAGIELNRSTCLGELTKRQEDFEVLKYYVMTGKFRRKEQ